MLAMAIGFTGKCPSTLRPPVGLGSSIRRREGSTGMAGVGLQHFDSD
jgi:hypothetical protein